jgi:hypothetical protein
MAAWRKLLRFNMVFAVSLILFFVAFALLWAYILMPICDARDWKLPCPPKGFTGMASGI